MTIGDVLAVIAAVVLVAASWGSTLLVVSLAFRSKAAAAENRIVSAPGSSFATGFAVIVVVGIAAALLNRSHAGPVRIGAGALLTGLAVLAAVGGAGIIRLLSERIQETGSPMQPFTTLTRSAALYVFAGLVPIFGWFVITPVAACLSVGGGIAAMLGRPGVRRSDLAPPGSPDGGLAPPDAEPLSPGASSHPGAEASRP